MDLKSKSYAIDLLINILKEHDIALEALAAKTERLLGEERGIK